jgi:hypothetical protein
MFGADSVPVETVTPGVNCFWYLQSFPLYCGPQYAGPDVVYVFPVPHIPFAWSVYPVGHVFGTTVFDLYVIQFDESPGIEKYPGGQLIST